MRFSSSFNLPDLLPLRNDSIACGLLKPEPHQNPISFVGILPSIST